MSETFTKTPEVDKYRGNFSIKQTKNPLSQTWRDTVPVEGEVFKLAGYADPEELQVEYAPYEDVSVMSALYDGDKAIGEVRIIEYNPELGFKTTNDIDRGLLDVDEAGRELLDSLDPKTMFEVGTIGLDPAYRTTGDDPIHPVTQLYGIIFTYGMDNNKPYVIASFDAEYLHSYEGLSGDSLTRLGPAKDYIGSPTVPVLIDLNRLKESLISQGAGEFVDTLLAVGHGVEHDD